MRYIVETTTQFKRDIKRCIKRGLDTDKVLEAMRILQDEGKLPPCYRQHRLSGRFNRYWECHIEPNWLLVWDRTTP